jgi:NTP pyrophosphatase (non-canonical NTP hydrolase)
MDDLNFSEMQAMQKSLQEKYRDKWTPLSPETGRNSLLWLIAEAGEVAEIIKKCGDEAIIGESETRHDFIEEICDVMMYLNDLMLCYLITPEELAEIYREKHERNMKRW